VCDKGVGVQGSLIQGRQYRGDGSLSRAGLVEGFPPQVASDLAGAVTSARTLILEWHCSDVMLHGSALVPGLAPRGL